MLGTQEKVLRRCGAGSHLSFCYLPDRKGVLWEGTVTVEEHDSRPLSAMRQAGNCMAYFRGEEGAESQPHPTSTLGLCFYMG